MAVTGLSGLFQTVVSGISEASKVLAPTWSAEQSIFWDHNPDEPGVLGKTLNVALPQDPSSQVRDIQSNDMIVDEANVATVPIVLNRHPQFSVVIRDYDQFMTPYQVKVGFADGALIALKNFINQDVANLANVNNFTTNATVVGTGSAVTTTQYTQALAVLARQRVPMGNPNDLTFLIPPEVYYGLEDPTTGTAGAAWTQAFIAGNRWAESVRETGQVPRAFGTTFRMDQQMPISGTAPHQTFSALLLHRWALAGVTRPIFSPPSALKVVDKTYLPFGKIEIRVMTGYDLRKGGEILSIDAAYGLAVVRENMAVPFSISQ